MNQIDGAEPRPASQGGPRQKIFNAVGWLAFALLLPPALAMFGLPQLQTAIEARLGGWGSPIALVVYFYVVLFLRVFFGSDQRYTPVLLGYAVSFIFFSNSLDIGFMRWLRDLSAGVPFLSYPFMSFIAGIVTIFLSNALSGARKANWVIDVVVLVALPAGALVAAGIYLPGLLGF
ncbi:MAG: hypothetical protein CVV47_02360 [Spirochaetae bacterium HGW-Spirochaetae-3]|jgi:hypothetical protein|nr:MAG: hypothetical protein CVV47_02360 [Spirochaetae bacterium HGW-Spirochaetae-3]